MRRVLLAFQWAITLPLSVVTLILMVIVMVSLAAWPVDAYLKLGVRNGDETRPARWSMPPIRYFVTDSSIPNLSALELEAAVGRAAATWQAVSTSTLTFEFVGFTSAQPSDEDGISTVGFLGRPDLERTLAATQFLIDEVTGDIVEADIFFNSAIPWSVSGSGEPGRYDLETIALHEMGHMLGLGHSGLGETELQPSGGRRVTAAGAVMFPIASAAGTIALRTLQPDDEAGVGDLYPDGSFTTGRGSISGRVTKGGEGVLGAHVAAFHLYTGALVGTFTLDAEGRYAIGGLEAGPHLIRVEPLDDASTDSFFLGAENIEVDFRVAYAERLAVVPRGGGAPGIDIQVIAK